MTESSGRPSLHVVFTMDCLPPRGHQSPDGPTDWILSGRSIDGFCGIARAAGFPTTLFLTPQAAAEHTPMLEDLSGLGAELGLLVHPPSLPMGKHGHLLGRYAAASQHQLVETAASALEEVLGAQPRSVRSSMFSASDHTYPILFTLGFRQGSLSSPGRKVGKHAAEWVGAETDAHYVSPESRLLRGSIPFLELPVTTDAGQRSGGIAPDLGVENGTVDAFHRPLIEGQLERFEKECVRFRALCFHTSNRRAYYGRGERMVLALEAVLEYVEGLESRYTLVPVTLAGAHAEFRRHSPPEVSRCTIRQSRT